MNLDQAMAFADDVRLRHVCLNDRECPMCVISVLHTELKRLRAIEERALRERDSIRRMSERIRANQGK